APAARPPRRAHPGARRRARCERGSRAARARAPRRGRRDVGKATDDERLDADRGSAARPRLPGLRGEGGAHPREDGEPARTSRRGTAAADRLPPRRRRRGSDRVRPRCVVMLEPDVETRAWDEQLELDDESYRAQLAYVLERSSFYREKLGAAGLKS